MLVDVVVVLEVVDVVVSGAPGEIGGFPALIAGPSRKVIGIALDLGCLDPSRVSRGFARWTGQVREGRHRSRRAGDPDRLNARQDLSRLFLKPIFLCVPSQNGLFADWPQRQSHVSFPSTAIVRPPSVTILNGPCTW